MEINSQHDLKNIIDSAIGIGSALTGVHFADKDASCTPFMPLPNAVKLESLEQFLPSPRRTRATPTFTDAQSFIDYVNRHKNPSTHIFANITTKSASFLAFIDYHDRETGPVWKDHVARFEATPTVEWTAWMSKNGTLQDQEQFARWIEEQELLFASPNGAELLELIQNLEGKNHVNFDSAVRLDNGKNALKFSEEVELRGGAGGAQVGVIEIPKEFILGIAPFDGMQKYQVRARLRYRIASRKLTFWYETVTPHLIVRDATNGLCALIEEKTEIKPLKGTSGGN